MITQNISLLSNKDKENIYREMREISRNDNKLKNEWVNYIDFKDKITIRLFDPDLTAKARFYSLTLTQGLDVWFREFTKHPDGGETIDLPYDQWIIHVNKILEKINFKKKISNL